MTADTAIHVEWVHLAYEEHTRFTETYGFAGNQGKVNLEGLRLRPAGLAPSETLLVYMHPSSTMQLLPVPRAMVAAGAHVLCAGSRYQRNDAALIMEKVLLDLGAYIRHAKKVWNYRNVVLVGWSGGGSLSMTYQSQAEAPSITHTPAGDPVDVKGAGLIPADAVVWQAAHLSRSHLLTESIDPSVRDELNPDDRDPELDIYNPRNPNQPPYTPEFIARYRAGQIARMRRITARARETLEALKARGGGEMERGFVVHRTLADPRYIDPALDPNGRKPRWCYLGNPETVNSGPVGLGRFSTLRSWLSQWSLDDTCANGPVCAAKVRAPLLVIENGADDAVPQPHSRILYEAAASPDKTFHLIPGATHYYAGQPKLMSDATQLIHGWLEDRGMRTSTKHVRGIAA
ncbi:MAG: alpha/beta hydrolase [Bradyrhizobium sp.]|jgi:dienelactone hydrolase|uniref:Alpha/beta hydrolase n=1 Tax=Caenimonas koreensis DSM 17982 TaxID=1121255 RepID=A0A844BDB6_9BURK|nr:alpha/beta hydrolase [Caenimonas koreensis]MRD49699.1 alpha/beta hydrolase [Caenimonas koreensis DSM 17982]